MMRIFGATPPSTVASSFVRSLGRVTARGGERAFRKTAVSKASFAACVLVPRATRGCGGAALPAALQTEGSNREKVRWMTSSSASSDGDSSGRGANDKGGGATFPNFTDTHTLLMGGVVGHSVEPLPHPGAIAVGGNIICSRSLSNSSRDGKTKDEVASSSKEAESGEAMTKAKKKKRRYFEEPPSLSEALQTPAGPLFGNGIVHDEDDIDDDMEDLEEGDGTTRVTPNSSRFFIPQIPLHPLDGRRKKRVLVLCTGGTLTMAPDPSRNGALAPVEGAVTAYMREMRELNADNMPEVVAHEYTPFFDSSDLGPSDWALLANDIKANYLHFDGFVVLMGTDTMAYAATALSFMLENLGKPVIFTGSQIPLCEPYNDARRNLIMALIFASRDTINEVSIFFHDRLLRACRSTKVNTHRLMAFDSPNMDPLAKIGITIDENEHLILPPARGALRVHSRMDTRILTIRLVPGFDDQMIKYMVKNGSESGSLKALVLQLYGTGNIPSVKDSFIRILAEAKERGILVIASTQCFTGSVMMGHYATGQALESAGVVSASDMTLEAISCKVSYLFGRGDLSYDEIANLMGVSLRGEITPPEALSPPPLSSAYQRASRKGKKYY